MSTENQTSRRLFLAAGSASAVFGALAQAAASTACEADPILDALARHKAAFDHLENVCGSDDQAAVALALDDEADALGELIETPPETRDGARAALEWFLRYVKGGGEIDVESFVATLLDSPVLVAKH